MPETSRHQALVPQKLAPGKEGRPIELLANFYKITTNAEGTVFHYDLEITRIRKAKDAELDLSSLKVSETPILDKSSSSPSSSDKSAEGSGEFKVKSKEAERSDRFTAKFADQVIKQLLTTSPTFNGVRYVHDNMKNLFTMKMIDLNNQRQATFAVVVDIDGRPCDFNVRVKLVDNIAVKEVIDYYMRKKEDLSERVVSVYEILLRFIMGKDYVTFQRKLFDLESITGSPKVSFIFVYLFSNILPHLCRSN